MQSFANDPEDSGSPAKVLVVDSDPRCVEELASALRAAGYTALQATAFAEGKRIMLAERPRVLVVDVRLEQFNGLQLLMRAQADQPDVRGVVTCAFADSVLEAETRRLGGAYLVKPVEPRRVVEVVRSLIPLPPALAASIERRQADRRKLLIPEFDPERRQSQRRSDDAAMPAEFSERRMVERRKLVIPGYSPERRLAERRSGRV